jgi:hypothetical protein
MNEHNTERPRKTYAERFAQSQKLLEHFTCRLQDTKKPLNTGKRLEEKPFQAIPGKNDGP